MTYLSRDDILKVDDLKTEEIDVPEWGGIVRIRELTGEALNDFQTSMVLKKPNGQPIRDSDGRPLVDVHNRSAKLVVRGVVNDDGEPLFSLVDVEALGAKSSGAIERLADAIAELSGMGDEAVEDAEGNSEAAQSGDSTSPSPETSSTVQ